MPFGPLGVLTLLNILNYLDRYIVAAMLPAIMDDVGLGRVVAGSLISAFVPGYVIFSPIFGYLGDRYSRPKLMAGGAVLWSLATLATGLTSNYYLFFVARVLVGIGEASFGTITPGYLKDRINDPVKLNSALSLFYCAIPVGSALGFVSGGVIAQHFSWRTAFILAGIPGILLATFVLKMKEVPNRTLPQVSLKEGLREISQSKILHYVVGGYILNSVALTGVASFLTDYGVSRGFALDEIGLYFGIILVVAGFAGTFLGGRFASWLARRAGGEGTATRRVLLYFVGIITVLAVPPLFLGFWVDDHMMFLVFCFIAEILIFAALAPVNSLIVISSPAAFVTLTQGMSILLINLFGSLPAPIYTGKIAELVSLRVALESLSIFLFLSGIVWLIGGERERRVGRAAA